MPDWFSQNAPKTSSGGDWFESNAPRRRPVSAEDFIEDKTPEGSALGRFASGVWESVNPVTAVKGIAHAVAHPIDTASGMVGAQMAEFSKAKELAKQGRYVEAAGHGAAGVVPLLGPAAAAAGEQMASGDVAGGLGKGVGLVAPVVIGALAPKSVGVRGAAAAPQTAEALAYAERTGIPLDVAAATDNRFLQAAQHVADRSLAGSLVASKAAKVQAERLATVGEQLAAKAHPTPVSAMRAGEAAQEGVSKVVGARRAEANTAYNRLRELEADPANVTTIEPVVPTPRADAPAFFTANPKAGVDDIFAAALKDARESGYTGKVGDLRAVFDKRVEQARSLKSATAEGDEYSHAALVKEIRDRGGLKPYEKEYRQGGPTQKVGRQEAQVGQDANRNYYGKNAVYRNDGLAADDIVQQLSEDPKWGAVITPDTDIHEVLRAGGGVSPRGNVPIEQHLRATGVKPGESWWMEGQQAQHVPMAVDISETKAAMRPIYDKLAAESKLVPFMSGSGKGRAFVALDRIMNGPDVAPLSVADSALSELKSMARSNDPHLRNVGQGIAAKAVDNLHRAVGEAAERAGPQAVTALEEGRIATKAKYAAAEVLKRLEGKQQTKSGTTAFRGLTQSADTSVKALKDVLTQAPETKPLVARAVLDGLLDHPKAGPAKTWADWQKIGPYTKSLLFEPSHVKDLDNFFLLRKRMAGNSNPSGTAHTLLTATQAGHIMLNPLSGAAAQLSAAAISKLLHSQAGVRLLTRGMTIPVRNAAARTAWLSELAAATSPSESQTTPAPAIAR